MTTVVNYQLANTAGYKFDIVKVGFNVYDQLSYYHKSNFPDVEITRPNTTTDLKKLHEKSLLTVNGYIYKTDYIGEKLYIPDATKSMTRSGKNSIGILSFNSLDSTLTKTPIIPAMLTQEYITSMYEKTIITFSKEIKTCVLVLAGYLIFEHPEFFYRVSSTSFALRLDRLNYMEKLYELNICRNIFDELGVPVSNNNHSVVDAQLVRSNDVIIKLLTLSNSFLVEIPAQSITLDRLYLEHSNLPGTFRTEIEPNLPMLVGYGKIAEYIKQKNNDTKYTVHTSDAYYNNHLFTKLNPEEVVLYNDHRTVGSTYKLSPAFFLKMSLD